MERTIQNFETTTYGVYEGLVKFHVVETVTKKLSEKGALCCWLHLVMEQLDEPDPSSRTREQYLYCGKPEDGWGTDGTQVWNNAGRKWSNGIGAGRFVMSLDSLVTKKEKADLPRTGWKFLEGQVFEIAQPEQRDRQGNIVVNQAGYPQREFVVVGRPIVNEPAPKSTAHLQGSWRTSCLSWQ